MDKAQAALDILAHAVPLAPFDGWSQRTLEQAAVNAGYKATDAIRVFPGGAIDAVDAFMRQGDARMIEELGHYHLDGMKIRERIALAVRLRLGVHEQEREALRRALALQALPVHAHLALKSLYHTVDAIWYAIGDQSTDFSFYTKRLTLAAVYVSARRYWLDDASAGHELSWAFLERRIAGVMAFEKAKKRLREWAKRPLAL